MVIHYYFMSLGVDEIRRRGAQDEKSLRMVKSILHELTKFLVRIQTSSFQIASLIFTAAILF